MIQIDSNLKGKSGIYMIINSNNNKRYIGSSKNLHQRFIDHLKCLRKGNHPNCYLQRSWNKYGEECFSISIIEYCDENIRFNREQYYIDLYTPEYNLTLNVAYKPDLSLSSKERISKTLKEKYTSGEIVTYKQEHAWIHTYIYDIFTFELVGDFKNKADALIALRGNNTSHNEFSSIYCKKYCLSKTKFKYLSELKNYIYKNIFILKKSVKEHKYLIVEDLTSLNLTYFQSLKECSKFLSLNESSIIRAANKGLCNINAPYIPKNKNCKIYYSNDFIELPEDQSLIIESIKFK